MTRSPELEAALEAAEAAARIIRECYQRPIDVRIKPDRSPVTEADVRSEQAIRAVLAARFPAYGFYGEETGRSGPEDNLWIVDPIDGTQSFIRGYPFFSTQIALMRRGQLTLGVSSAPLYGELACAERGKGAFMNGRRLSVSGISDLKDATVSTGNLRSLTQGPQWAAYGKIVAQVARSRGYGDFLHYHLLAAGRIDVAIETNLCIYDIAALVPIVEEAGGRFTALDGEPIDLDSTTVLATNGLLHDTVRAMLSSG